MQTYRHLSRQPVSYVDGFTLIELIIVIILAGILSVVALPRIASNTFDERGFHDSVKSVLQHARHVAIASRRFVCVDVADGVVSLTRDEALPDGKTSIECNAALTLLFPEKSCASTNQICAPKGVFISGTSNLIFDPLGRLVNMPSSMASAANITISNQPNITVEPETGFVE